MRRLSLYCMEPINVYGFAKQEAEQSLRFYRNCYGENNPQSEIEVKEELQKLITIAKQKSEMPSIDLSDFRKFHIV